MSNLAHTDKATKMTSKIEEVARAMMESLTSGSCGWAYASGTDPKNMTLDGDFDLIDLASSAIQAMREPSEAMKEADKPWSVGDAPPNCWVRMIDAALSEDK
jgi:hypothetical protein